MCKGETVQRSYLLKYAAKLRITEQACKWTFVGLAVFHRPQKLFCVCSRLFRVLRHTMVKYVIFLQKVAGGALSLGGLLLVTFVNI